MGEGFSDISKAENSKVINTGAKAIYAFSYIWFCFKSLPSSVKDIVQPKKRGV
jgi:hypothetical protein